jgi:hypothetical protein
MRIRSLPALFLPILLIAAAGAATAQTAETAPGHAPGLSKPAPSVDTNPNQIGTMGAPSENTQAPSTTGSTDATTPDTMHPGAKSSINAGASGRNPCYPGQSGKTVGSTNPSGQASRC